jgi:hypothetical protein
VPASTLPRALAALALGGLLLAACREGPAPEGGAPADSTRAPADTVRLVPLHGVALRLEPREDGDVLFEAAAGDALRLVEARGDWLRLATWDDRAGWAPEAAFVELALWVHYQQALGGAPLSDLRPGYPLGDGRWAVEAPPPSPGVMTAGSVWLLGSDAMEGSVVGRDAVASSCGGLPHRFGILEEAPPGGAAAAAEPVLGRARLVTTAAPGAALRALAPEPAAPDPAQVEAVRRLADSLGSAIAAGRDPASGRPIPPPARFAAAEWLALGEGALWATLAGEPGRANPDAPSWAAAVLVTGGAEPAARLVVAPFPSPALPPALRPLLAFSTRAGGGPTLFAIERMDYRGRRIELYVARERDVRPFYRGYDWGC